MPNWCSNKVIISGEKSVLDEIVEKANVAGDYGDFSFSAFLPVPPMIENKPKDFTLSTGDFVQALAGNTNFEYSNGYDWRIANWGTKWDTDNATLLTNNHDYIEYYFNTAWSPPVQFCVALSKLYPVSITNLYYEEGMGFAGRAVAENGSLIRDEYYDTVSPEQYKSVGAVLDENGFVDWDVPQDYNLFDLFK